MLSSEQGHKYFQTICDHLREAKNHSMKAPLRGTSQISCPLLKVNSKALLLKCVRQMSFLLLTFILGRSMWDFYLKVQLPSAAFSP